MPPSEHTRALELWRQDPQSGLKVLNAAQVVSALRGLVKSRGAPLLPDSFLAEPSPSLRALAGAIPPVEFALFRSLVRHLVALARAAALPRSMQCTLLTPCPGMLPPAADRAKNEANSRVAATFFDRILPNATGPPPSDDLAGWLLSSAEGPPPQPADDTEPAASTATSAAAAASTASAAPAAAAVAPASPPEEPAAFKPTLSGLGGGYRPAGRSCVSSFVKTATPSANAPTDLAPSGSAERLPPPAAVTNPFAAAPAPAAFRPGMSSYSLPSRTTAPPAAAAPKPSPPRRLSAEAPMAAAVTRLGVPSELEMSGSLDLASRRSHSGHPQQGAASAAAAPPPPRQEPRRRQRRRPWRR